MPARDYAARRSFELRSTVQAVAAARRNQDSAASVFPNRVVEALLDPDYIQIGDGLAAVENPDGSIAIGMVSTGSAAGGIDGGAPDRLTGGMAAVDAGLPGAR